VLRWGGMCYADSQLTYPGRRKNVLFGKIPGILTGTSLIIIKIHIFVFGFGFDEITLWISDIYYV
jgi:hypothetical protein